MATSISWTNETWNPVTGCSKVSPGCAHCYAENLSMRFGWSKKPWTPENAQENVVLHPERLEKPLHWREPKRVFVNSMSDLFHELVPNWFIEKVFAVMAATPQHTYQVLTKRPERMKEFAGDSALPYKLERLGKLLKLPIADQWPLPNVWLGTSVENQHFADLRIPELLATPAAVRFLSCEPLLGRISLNEPMPGAISKGGIYPPWYIQSGIHWVIVGGESGPGFRTMDLNWARQLRDQCVDARVPFFFKQQSARRSETNPHLDGYEWHQFPGNLAEPVPVAVAV